MLAFARVRLRAVGQERTTAIDRFSRVRPARKTLSDRQCLKSSFNLFRQARKHGLTDT